MYKQLNFYHMCMPSTVLRQHVWGQMSGGYCLSESDVRMSIGLLVFVPTTNCGGSSVRRVRPEKPLYPASSRPSSCTNENICGNKVLPSNDVVRRMYICIATEAGANSAYLFIRFDCWHDVGVRLVFSDIREDKKYSWHKEQGAGRSHFRYTEKYAFLLRILRALQFVRTRHTEPGELSPFREWDENMFKVVLVGCSVRPAARHLSLRLVMCLWVLGPSWTKSDREKKWTLRSLHRRYKYNVYGNSVSFGYTSWGGRVCVRFQLGPKFVGQVVFCCCQFGAHKSMEKNRVFYVLLLLKGLLMHGQFLLIFVWVGRGA